MQLIEGQIIFYIGLNKIMFKTLTFVAMYKDTRISFGKYTKGLDDLT